MARITIPSKQDIATLETQLEQLRSEQERNQTILDVLYHISVVCGSSISLRQIFEVTYRQLRTIFAIDTCYIAIRDTHQSDIFSAALVVDGDTEQFVEQATPGMLTRRIIEHGTPLLFRDLVQEYAQIDSSPEMLGTDESFSHSWLGVPLMVGQIAIGVISIQSYQIGLYDEHDRDLLQRLGDIVAVALENVRLAQHQRELSDALATRVSERSQELAMLSTLASELVLQHTLPVLLSRALELIIPLLDIDGGAVRLLEPPGTAPIDPRGRELVLVAYRGFPTDFAEIASRYPVVGTPLGNVVIENKPLVIQSGLKAYHLHSAIPPFEALLGVPMCIGERILGTLSLVSTQQKLFTQENIDLAQAISNQLAIAVENARLFSDRERQIAELWAINRISRAAGSALDLVTLLRHVHEALRNFMQLSAFSMVIYDPERQVVTDGVAIEAGQPYSYLHNQPPRPGSITEWVIRHRTTLHFSNFPEELEYYPDMQQYFVGANKPAAAWLGVPMFDRDERVIGVIAIQGANPSTFGERDELFLFNLARQVALHVQNVQLLMQRERQIRELDAIGKIGKLVSASLDNTEILQGVYETLYQLTQAPVFYLAICEPETLIITNSFFIEQGEQTDLAWQGRPPDPGSLTEAILRQGRPLLFPDLVDQREELQAIGIIPKPFGNDFVVRSWVGVPLLAKDGETIGLIALQDNQAYVYDDQTIDFLSQVASHISLGVQKLRLFADRERQLEENARLFKEAQAHAAAAKRQAHEMELVYRISSVLSSRLDQQEILELASQELVQLFWADHTGTMLFDDAMQWGTVAAEYPLHAALGIRASLVDNPIVDELLASRRPVCIVSVDDDPRAHVSRAVFKQLGIASLMIVPLVSRGRMIGSISLDSFTPRVFSEEEQELFVTVAAAIAAAIENARLFAAEQEHAAAAERQAKRMELVNRISVGLSDRLDLHEILSLAVREVVHLFWADHAGIMFFDDDNQWSTVVAEYPDHGALGWELAVTENHISMEIIATRRPVHIHSLDTDLRAQLLREKLRKIGVVSMMVVPLMSRGRVIGSIGLDSFNTARVFTEDDQELFLVVANSIAAAVENARLFAAEQEARRTADTLREVARVLSSSVDPAEVLQLILRELHNVIAYDTASIMLVEGTMLRIAACRGWEAADSPHGVAFPISGSGAGRVVLSRHPLVMADIRAAPDWSNKTIGGHIRSWLGVPLIVKGALLGVLNIDSREVGHFNERDAEVAQAFANQAAVALENARLYQESVTRVEQELAIARQIQRNLFPRSLPQAEGLVLDATCVPARETGGDFYDVIPLSEQRMAITIGDVSGKSIPAAMLMAVARSVTRSEADDRKTPQTVVHETNRWIVRDVPRRTFVALCYAKLDVQRRHLAFTNAGQLSPIRRRATGQIEYLEAPDPRLPLGIAADVAYTALELTLDPGDLLVFYTDGVVEAHNAAQELFGFERFEALIRDQGHLPPQQFIAHVLQAVTVFADGTPQHDDITLVVVHIA